VVKIMEKKFILTEKELFELINNSYVDGFFYAMEKEDIFKKFGDSQGKDAPSYTRKKIKGLK